MLAAATPPAPSFVAAYLDGQLNDFFELRPGDVDAALELPRAAERGPLVDALTRYARSLGAPDAVFRNLERLRHPRARAVVTGQQTGLLLGPTYTLSKAVTAVALARRLDSAERPVVPLFWLATQDHDAHEMDHCYLLDGSETLRRLAVPLPAGVAVGRARFTTAMLAAVEDGLASLTPPPRFLGEVRALLRDTAADAATYPDWFGAILTRLLGEQGLVLVDPLRADVAALFRDVLAAELADAGHTPHAVNAAGRRLKAIGFEAQLGRGADATNLFVEVDGRRVLLRRRGAGFTAGERDFTGPELVAMLGDDPTVVTPAAGLRPVVQDALLPTAVFVLGPGELRYVAQLRDVYRFHDVPMPLAWPRASATVLEPPVARLLAKYGLDAAGYCAHPERAEEAALLALHGHAAGFAASAAAVEAQVVGMLDAVNGIDPTLDRAVRKGGERLAATLERLRHKVGSALARTDATTARQFDRLRAHLLPGGEKAERVLSPLSHALKFGVRPVVDLFLTLEPSGEQELRV